MSDPSRIYLIDDHPVIRHGVRAVLERHADLTVCGEASDAEAALPYLRDTEVDIAIIDLVLDRASGFDLIKRIRSEHSDLPLLVLSIGEEHLYAPRALRAGANGYLMKGAAPTDIVHAVRTVLSGETYVSDDLRDRLVREMASGKPAPVGTPAEQLSDRELEVFELIGRGLITRNIAERLNLSVKTIETYRLKIKQKMGLSNATEVVQHAVLWVNRRHLNATP